MLLMKNTTDAEAVKNHMFWVFDLVSGCLSTFSEALVKV